jgi:integrase
MRKMEILSLKWDYIDLEKNFITLPQTNTKAKKTRVIPINSLARTVFLELKIKSDGSSYVFPSESKNGHISWITHSFGSSCKRAKIENLRFHDLRHTCATRMLEAGADIVSVSKILGHSDINLTIKRYIHLEESLKSAVERLANFSPNCSQNYSQPILSEN